MEMVHTASNTMMKKLGDTYKFVFAGLVLATIGSWVAMPLAASLTGFAFWGLVILEFVVLFGFIFTKHPALFYTFTAITGVTLVPVLDKFITAGAGFVIVQALTITAVIVGGLTMYALTTKKNFLGYGTVLLWALVGVIVLAVINMFIASSLLSLMISGVTAVLFSFFIIHDTQQVIHTDIEPIDAAMGMYLNILNMFTSILNLLGLGWDD